MYKVLELCVYIKIHSVLWHLSLWFHECSVQFHCQFLFCSVLFRLCIILKMPFLIQAPKLFSCPSIVVWRGFPQWLYMSSQLIDLIRSSLVLKQKKVCAFASQTFSSFLPEIEVRNLRKRNTVTGQNNSQLEGETKRLTMGCNSLNWNFLLLTAKN